MLDPDDVDNEPFDAELFDVSDVDYRWGHNKRKKEIYLIMRTKLSPFCDMKTYLALKRYVREYEEALNIISESDTEQ